MANFGEMTVKPVTETPEEVAARLAGDLELVPIEKESEAIEAEASQENREPKAQEKESSIVDEKKSGERNRNKVDVSEKSASGAMTAFVLLRPAEPMSEEETAKEEQRREREYQERVKKEYGPEIENFLIDARTVNPEGIFKDRQSVGNEAGIRLGFRAQKGKFEAYFGPIIKNVDRTLPSMSVSASVFPEFKKMKAKEIFEELKKLNKAKPFTIDQLAALFSDQFEIDEKREIKVKEPLGVFNNIFLVVDKNNSITLLAAIPMGEAWILGYVGTDYEYYTDTANASKNPDWGGWFSNARFISLSN